MPLIRGEQIKDGSVTGADIADLTIQNEDIATNADIDQSKINSTTGWITSGIAGAGGGGGSTSTTYVAAETIADRKVIAVDEDGEAIVASKNNSTKVNVVGFTSFNLDFKTIP